MIKEFLTPENLAYAQQALGILFLAMAFSNAQKLAIRDRDGNRCQATAEHICNGPQGLEIDHILPQRYCYSLGIDPDFPENALTKCKNAHDIKHPDRVPARQTYHATKAHGEDTFKQLAEVRDQQVTHRVVYWNTDNDRTDSARALQLTQRARKHGWVFPPKSIK